jgi:hypothetical protein
MKATNYVVTDGINFYIRGFFTWTRDRRLAATLTKTEATKIRDAHRPYMGSILRVEVAR